MVTRNPRDLSNRPREEAVMPFPRELATPPVTKMCFVTRQPSVETHTHASAGAATGTETMTGAHGTTGAPPDRAWVRRCSAVRAAVGEPVDEVDDRRDERQHDEAPDG